MSVAHQTLQIRAHRQAALLNLRWDMLEALLYADLLDVEACSQKTKDDDRDV